MKVLVVVFLSLLVQIVALAADETSRWPSEYYVCLSGLERVFDEDVQEWNPDQPLVIMSPTGIDALMADERGTVKAVSYSFKAADKNEYFVKLATSRKDTPFVYFKAEFIDPTRDLPFKLHPLSSSPFDVRLRSSPLPGLGQEYKVLEGGGPDEDCQSRLSDFVVKYFYKRFGKMSLAGYGLDSVQERERARIDKAYKEAVRRLTEKYVDYYKSVSGFPDERGKKELREAAAERAGKGIEEAAKKAEEQLKSSDKQAHRKWHRVEEVWLKKLQTALSTCTNSADQKLSKLGARHLADVEAALKSCADGKCTLRPSLDGTVDAAPRQKVSGTHDGKKR